VGIFAADTFPATRHRPGWQGRFGAGALAVALLIAAVPVAATAAGGKPPTKPAAELYARGLELAGQKDYRWGRATLVSASQKDPNHPYAELVARLVEQVAAGKTSPDVLQLVVEGLQREAAGSASDAVERLSKAAALAPADALVRHLLGLVYEHGVKDDAKAMAAYRATLEADPKFVRASVALADILTRRGECDQAIAECSTAIVANARFAQAYVSRAQAYQAKGDLAKATADFEKALQLRPTAAVYRLLAAVHEKAGRTKDAEAARAAADKLDQGAGAGTGQ